LFLIFIHFKIQIQYFVFTLFDFQIENTIFYTVKNVELVENIVEIAALPCVSVLEKLCGRYDSNLVLREVREQQFLQRQRMRPVRVADGVSSLSIIWFVDLFEIGNHIVVGTDFVEVALIDAREVLQFVFQFFESNVDLLDQLDFH
jgi:hypothetical protein